MSVSVPVAQVGPGDAVQCLGGGVRPAGPVGLALLLRVSSHWRHAPVQHSAGTWCSACLSTHAHPLATPVLKAIKHAHTAPIRTAVAFVQLPPPPPPPPTHSHLWVLLILIIVLPFHVTRCRFFTLVALSTDCHPVHYIQRPPASDDRYCGGT